jgi:DNA replication protein DnaC
MGACELCQGTGFEIVDRDGHEFAQPCACRTEAKAGPSDFIRRCRIPARYEQCNLGNFDPWTPSSAAALEKALVYCNGYPHLGRDEGLGLLLTGGNGVGKTHLAVGVLHELATGKGAFGQFWDFHELIREIRNSYNEETRTTELQVLEPVIETSVLLLDDLGAWRMTDWMVDTLFFIINQRYLAKRATIITTNFPDVSAEQAAADRSNRRTEYLVERIGGSLRSRLMEMCVVIRMDGPDFRQFRQTPRSGPRSAENTPGEVPGKRPVPRFGG